VASTTLFFFFFFSSPPFFFLLFGICSSYERTRGVMALTLPLPLFLFFLFPPPPFGTATVFFLGRASRKKEDTLGVSLLSFSFPFFFSPFSFICSFRRGSLSDGDIEEDLKAASSHPFSSPFLSLFPPLTGRRSCLFEKHRMMIGGCDQPFHFSFFFFFFLFPLFHCRVSGISPSNQHRDGRKPG